MDLSIIIVNYNTRHITAACIESIYACTTGIRFEVILVDNASTDDSKEHFSRDGRISYIYNHENIGFGRANNLGLAVARGRNILFLNPDTLLLNNAAAILSMYLDSHDKVAVVGGNLYGRDMQPMLSFRRQRPSIGWEVANMMNHLPEKILLPRRWYFNFTSRPIRVGYITGADLMARRADVKAVGGFSEDFFMYYEDTDLCQSLLRLRPQIISHPEARIQHLEGGSFEEAHINRRRILLSEQGRHTYYKRNHSRRYHRLANDIYLASLTLHSLCYKLLRRRTQYRASLLRRLIVRHLQLSLRN